MTKLTPKIKNKNLAIVGLGKLGLCSALCFAKGKFKVTGYDLSNRVIQNISKKKFDNFEPNVKEYLNKYKNNYYFTDDLDKIANKKLIFIIVPTPSKKNWEFSNEYIYAFLNKFINTRKKLKINSFFHLVLSSTVMPGSCREFIKMIEKKLSLKLNKDFYFSYNPEFIALGTVIRDFENPDMVLIGSSSRRSANELISIYKKSVIAKSFEPMSIESAEITKIALNSYTTLKISFSNMIMKISDKVKNANPYQICKALGQDKRISPYYFRPGLPFSGPCFPRDNQAFNFFQKKIGIKNFITNATINTNKLHIQHLNNKIYKEIKLKKYKKILVLGLSFKNTTSVTEESYSIKLIDFLLKKKLKVNIYEKNINKNNFEIKKYFNLMTKKINQNKFDLIINTNSTKFKKLKNTNYLDLWQFDYI